MPLNASQPLRLVVRVLQQILRDDPTVRASYADVADALKCRLARLRIPYDSTIVSAAIDQLDRGGRTPIVNTRPPSAPLTAPVVDASPLVDRNDAAALLKEWHATVREIPTAPVDATHAARVQRQAVVFRRVRPPRRPIAERLAEIFGGADADDRQRQRERDEIDAAIDAATRRMDGDA